MTLSLSEQFNQIPKWKFGYGFVLAFCWVVGAIFQIGNPGWFLIIFGLVYCVTFPLHIIFWGYTIIRRTAVTPWTHLSFFSNNLLFLAANVLNVDFGDTSSYMFLMQYENPPDYLTAVSFGLYLLWFITLMIDLAVRLVHYYTNRNQQPDN